MLSKDYSFNEFESFVRNVDPEHEFKFKNDNIWIYKDIVGYGFTITPLSDILRKLDYLYTTYISSFFTSLEEISFQLKRLSKKRDEVLIKSFTSNFENLLRNKIIEEKLQNDFTVVFSKKNVTYKIYVLEDRIRLAIIVSTLDEIFNMKIFQDKTISEIWDEI